MAFELRRRRIKRRNSERGDDGVGRPVGPSWSRRDSGTGFESDSDSEDERIKQVPFQQAQPPPPPPTSTTLSPPFTPTPTFTNEPELKPFLQAEPTSSPPPFPPPPSSTSSPPGSPSPFTTSFSTSSLPQAVTAVPALVSSSASSSFSSSSSSSSTSSTPTATSSSSRPALPAIITSFTSSAFISASSSSTAGPPSPQFENAPSPTTSRIPAPRLHPHFDLSFLLPVIIGTVTVTLGLTLFVAQILRKRRRQRRAEERMRVGLAMLDRQAKEELKRSWAPSDTEKPPLPPPSILAPVGGGEKGIGQRVTLPTPDATLKGDPVEVTQEMESSNPALHRRLLRRLAGLSVATSSHSQTKSTTTSGGRGIRAKFEGFIKRSARVDAEMRLQGIGRLAGGGGERQREADAMPMKEKMEESEKKGYEHPLGAWGKMTSWGNESQYWKKPMAKREPSRLTEIKVDTGVSRTSNASGETTAV